MQWYAPANGRRGRQRVFSDAAIRFCLSIKCLFGPALRQSLLRLAGLAWKVPDFSTVFRRQKTLRVQLPYRSSAMALDLLVHSTGNMGVKVAGGSAADLATSLQQERPRYSRPIRTAGISLR